MPTDVESANVRGSEPGNSDHEAPAVPSDEIDGVVALLQTRFSARLVESDLGQVRDAVEDTLKTGIALRRHRLTNADEPDFVFHPSVELE